MGAVTSLTPQFLGREVKAIFIVFGVMVHIHRLRMTQYS